MGAGRWGGRARDGGPGSGPKPGGGGNKYEDTAKEYTSRASEEYKKGNKEKGDFYAKHANEALKRHYGTE